MTSVPDTAQQGRVLRYSNTAVTIHWITVILVLAQAYFGFTFALSEAGPARDAIFIWHKTTGVVILLLTLARLAYRLKNPPPPFPPDIPAWERFAAVWNHRLFYLLLIAMPIVGVTAASGMLPGSTIPLLGGIAIPKVPGISNDLAETLGDVHVAAAWLLIALLVVHAAAALKHQFFDHNRAAGRMPPFHAPGGEQAVIGQG